MKTLVYNKSTKTFSDVEMSGYYILVDSNKVNEDDIKRSDIRHKMTIKAVEDKAAKSGRPIKGVLGDWQVAMEDKDGATYAILIYSDKDKKFLQV